MTKAESIKATKTGRHIKSLDGVRALAILLVLGFHAGTPGFQAGWLGVDLFFCVSGFLITTLLLEEHSNTGAVNLKNFWMRRFLRLLPSYYLYVVAITLVMWFWSGSVRQERAGWSPLEFTLSLWFYGMNFPPLGGIWNGQQTTNHLWSLAIEEQYYLLWPLLFTLLISIRQRLEIVSWCLVVFSLALFLMLYQEQRLMLYTRGISLFFASALAITVFRWKSRLTSSGAPKTSNRIFMMALICSAVAFGAAATGKLTEVILAYYVLPFLVVLYTCFVASLWYVGAEGWLNSFLSSRVLVYVGKISYGIYLYHQAARLFVWEFGSGALAFLPNYMAYGVKLTVYVLLSVGVAHISFYYFESRFLRLKNRFR